MKGDFRKDQIKNQIEWKQKNISTSKNGFFKGKPYRHIVPKELWKDTLWNPIRGLLLSYLNDSNIQHHSGVNNLLSSWIACVNLYFIIRENKEFKNLFLKFLQERVSQRIVDVNNVELEFAFNNKLCPEKILGERGGKRGAGQTSPDISFLVTTEKSKGVIFVENKYAERNFSNCSARRKDDSKKRVGNSDPGRCMKAALNCDYKNICHQVDWGRKYWSHFSLTEYGRLKLTRCPAATAGYQLFRQQALANGVAKQSDFDLVVSTVAFDKRNQELVNCLKTTGIQDFTKDWKNVVQCRAIFKSWSHQEWVEFVRRNRFDDLQIKWIDYIEERYGY